MVLPEHLEKLRKEIEDAFQEVVIPPSSQLVVATDDLNKNAAEKTRLTFADQKWQQLDLAFLKKNWASFCYFTAETFRYFLPALLTRSLECFSDESDLLHSAVYELTPSFCEIYRGKGRDSFFEYQISALTERQYAVVANFFHHIIKGDFGFFYRYQAARAIRWGWSHDPSQAVIASQAFYKELYGYHYPECTDEKDQALVNQIREAFADTPMPVGDRLTGSVQTDEPYEISLEFQGQDWQTLHPEFLSYHSASLSFFTAEAIRYYLPAYLIDSIYRSDGNGNPVFALTYGFTKERSQHRQYSTQKMSLFNQKERRAILAYLNSRMSDPYEKPEIEEAIATYWVPSISF